MKAGVATRQFLAVAGLRRPRRPSRQGVETEPEVPPRGAKAPKAAKIPKPPRRPPSSAKPSVVLTSRDRVIRSVFMMVAALLLSFVVNLTLVSQVQHLAAQQQLGDAFRVQLADGTAPVSEGDVDDVLLPDGAPVGLVDIPRIGVHEYLVEGTDSSTLRSGPGHRRDSVLPGQAGWSFVFARAAAYGGPFSRIEELPPGAKFTIITGQGKHTFEVIGVRYAGDPTPPPPKAGESRLTLVTARGAAFTTTGVAWVDAHLTSTAQPAGARQTTWITLQPSDGPLATDTSTVWALVFAAQLLVLVEVVAVWAFRRVGARQTWIVFVPVVTLTSLIVTDQVMRLLPNLL